MSLFNSDVPLRSLHAVHSEAVSRGLQNQGRATANGRIIAHDCHRARLSTHTGAHFPLSTFHFPLSKISLHPLCRRGTCRLWQASTAYFPDCSGILCIALRCTTLHCTALHCTVLYCRPSHRIALHCIMLHCRSVRCLSSLIFCLLLFQSTRAPSGSIHSPSSY